MAADVRAALLAEGAVAVLGGVVRRWLQSMVVVERMRAAWTAA